MSDKCQERKSPLKQKDRPQRAASKFVKGTVKNQAALNVDALRR
jgi:hypothetical protein